MKEVATVGIDIAESVFQVHGINAVGDVVTRRKLRRSEVVEFFQRLPACLIGIEACASGHHWARTLVKMGHDVKLMPAAYVKPYVNARKMMRRMQKRSVKRCSARRCASCRSRVKSSKAFSCCTVPGNYWFDRRRC